LFKNNNTFHLKRILPPKP